MNCSITSLLLITAVLAVSTIANGDEIRLRASVRLAHDANAIRLADVAELIGPEAERFADLVLVDSPDTSEPVEIAIRTVREKLDAADAHWGRINLIGRKVVVRGRLTSTMGTPKAMTGATLVAGQDDRSDRTTDTVASTVRAEPTLRGAIARFMGNQLKADPSRLKLSFERNDSALLDTPENEYRFELQLQSDPASDRVTMVVRLWVEARVVNSHRLVIRPTVLIDVPICNRDIKRDQIIDAEDFDTEMRWLPPMDARATADPSWIAGRAASKSLRAGDIIRTRAVERPTVMHRGERVTVRCLVGGVAISLQAEARENGSVGDAIEFRKIGEREIFLATVAGPNEAIIDLTK